MTFKGLSNCTPVIALECHFYVFSRVGYELIDYIADYLENIRRYKVYPSVKPGYLKAMVPAKAPEKSEDWDKILGDVDRVIIPGVRTSICDYQLVKIKQNKS